MHTNVFNYSETNMKICFLMAAHCMLGLLLTVCNILIWMRRKLAITSLGMRLSMIKGCYQ